VARFTPGGMSENDDDLPVSLTSEPLSRAIGERYLTYALSTIMHRALPDARDGLKPVHRRILYAMRELKLSPTGGFRKSAKISGDVMGNYHPHGDAAIYDAMARLAQDFAMRYPLVDGQGNFGNIDGDNPAASRYTEARLAHPSEALLEGLAENAVDFRPNYDGTLEEPVVLPAAFPNLLANGSSGIAVGMATNIPPHNLHELIDGCFALIKTPDLSDEALVELVPGPDFPTGGVLVEPRESILENYRSGRGAFRLRARWEVEDLGRGMWQIVVTEIPYQVQKSKLIERLAELIQTKKVPALADVRDESAEDVRIVLEPRTRTVEPAQLMGMLFRSSDLELRFNMNMNVLIDGRVPKVCSLKEVLRAFLDHRRDVLCRRSEHRLDKIAHRLEVLNGYIIAYLNLDRVIEIIRTEDEPKPALMAENWAVVDGERAFLTEVQAEAILNMRLRSLRKLEEMELRNERDALMAERADLQGLLASEREQWKRITAQLKDVQKQFGKATAMGARRTSFGDAAEVEDVPIEAMIEREPITVILSKMGWVRALKGHQPLDAEVKFKDGDGPLFALHAETTDRIVALGSNGRAFTVLGANLPGGRGIGRAAAADRRSAERGRDHPSGHSQSRREISAGLFGRRRVRGAGRRTGGTDPRGQTGAEHARRRAHAGLSSGCGRSCRVRRGKPQDASVCAGRTAGNGPRQRRQVAKIQGWRAVGRDYFRACRRAELERSGGAHPVRDGPGRMAGQAGQRRPDGAARFPAGQSLLLTGPGASPVFGRCRGRVARARQRRHGALATGAWRIAPRWRGMHEAGLIFLLRGNR